MVPEVEYSTQLVTDAWNPCSADNLILPFPARHHDVEADEERDRTVAPFRRHPPPSPIPDSTPPLGQRQQIILRYRNENCRLLQLPAEIRIKIWTLVLGERTVHLTSWHDDSGHTLRDHPFSRPGSRYILWSIIPCLSKYSAMELFEMSTLPVDVELGIPSGPSYSPHFVVRDEKWTHDEWQKTPIADRNWCTKRLRTWLYSHGSCQHRFHNAAHAHTPDVVVRDFCDGLSFIMACKNIFEEVRDTFFAITTFAFHEPLSLQRFARLHNLKQLQLVRSLDLTISVHGIVEPFDNTEAWTTALNSVWLRRLQNLSRLHVYIKQEEQAGSPQREAGLHSFRNKVTQALQRLNLQNITVIVDNLPSTCGARLQMTQIRGMEERHDLGRRWASIMRIQVMNKQQ